MSQVILSALAFLAVACTTAHARNDAPGNHTGGDDSGIAEDPDLANATLIPELRRFLQGRNQLVKPTLEVVPPKAIAADIEFLKVMLPGSYGGYDASVQAGFSWDSAFATLSANTGQMSAQDWQGHIASALAGLQDQHLAIMRVRSDGGFEGWTSIAGRKAKRFELDPSCSSSSSVSAERHFADGAQELDRTVTYVGESAPESTNCPWHEVENPRRDRDRTPSVVALSDKVTLVHVHDFSSRDTAMWQTFKATAASLRSAQTIVIDLRGNTGGDDDQFYSWLVDLLGKRPKTIRFERLGTPWVQLNLVNYFTQQIAVHAGDDAWQQHVQQYRRSFLEQLASVTAGTLSDRHWDIWDRANDAAAPTISSPFAGQMIALVDRRCASACELTVKTLRGLSNVTVIGENTYGMAVSGENGPKRLPGSGLALQWGQWIETDLRDGFGGFHEGTGFLPDVWLAPGSAESNETILALVAALERNQ